MSSARAFEPKAVTITAGEAVRWANTSTEQHTVTAEEDSMPDGAEYFATGDASTEEAANDDLSASLIGPGETYSHTFDEPGTYRYYCIPHEGVGMVGTVVVQEG